MDIRKWLAETEDPILSKQPDVDRFLLPRQPNTVPDARRRRKRSSSDSSLLRAASPQLRHEGVTAEKLDRCGVPDAINNGHSDGSCFTSGGSTGSSTATQRYARKPRRKTRPDKYEVGSKRAMAQDKGQRPSRESNPRVSKRKSRHRKDEKTHNGIRQEFQARNVSNERLTLKPSERIGLFSKGRTSTSIRVPDLVFSEMKYLQDNNGGADSTTQALHAKKKRKKDHPRAKEEDISAYFTSVRPALADTDGNTQAKSRCPTGTPVRLKAGHARPMQDPSRAPGTAAPPTESEGEASFLGFGSRGLRHESTNCFSWSDSMRAPSATPRNHMDAPTDQDKRCSIWNRDTGQAQRGSRTPGHREMPVSVVGAGATATSNRVRMLSIVPMSFGMSRSQALPHPSSSPQRPGVVNRTVDRHTKEDMTSPSSMPPILQGCPHAGHQEDPTTERSIRTSYISARTELMGSRTSIDALKNPFANERPPELVESGGPLRHYEETSEAASQQGPTRKDHRIEARPPARSFDTDPQGRRDSSRRTVEVSAVQLSAPDFRALGLSHSAGPSIYVRQERRQLLPVGLGFVDDGGYDDLNGDGYGQEYISEAGVLDHEEFMDLPGEQLPCEMMEGLHDDVGGRDNVADGVEQVQEPEHMSVVRPGFWRPNKLY